MTDNKTQVVNINWPPVAHMFEWEEFMRSLRFSNRFTLPPTQDQFVMELLDYASKYKEKEFKAGTKSFFRARAYQPFQESPYKLNELEAPDGKIAGHGRLNPKGISYLYLASTQLTALCEVRAWVGARVCVAKCKLVQDVNLINFSNRVFASKVTKNPSPMDETWRQLISWMFSAPFDSRDDTAYVPTQYIAERIKGLGYDGILYDSALNSKGYNVALFNTQAAVPVSQKIAHVRELKLRATYS